MVDIEYLTQANIPLTNVSQDGRSHSIPQTKEALFSHCSRYKGQIHGNSWPRTSTASSFTPSEMEPDPKGIS